MGTQKKFFFNLIIFGGALFFLPFLCGEAHAGYLDPGSGSMFIQKLIAFFAFWGGLFAKVKKIFRRDKSNDE